MGEPDDAGQAVYRSGDLGEVARVHASLARVQLRCAATEVFVGAAEGQALDRLRKTAWFASLVASVLVGLVVSALLPGFTEWAFRGWVYLGAGLVSGMLFHAVVGESLVTRLHPRAQLATSHAARVTRRWIARHPSLSQSASEDLRAWVDELVLSINPSSEYDRLRVECERLRAQLETGEGSKLAEARLEAAQSD